MEWQPIETAPKRMYFDHAPEALLYGPNLGVRMGRVAVYPDGVARGSIVNCSGGIDDWGVTHWMPLPPPPERGAKD